MAFEALAYFYADMSRLDETNNYEQQSVEILRDHEDREMLPLAMKTAGYVLYELGLLSESLVYHEQCLAIRKNIAPHRAEAGIELAEIYEMLGDLDSARSVADIHCSIYQHDWSRYYAALGMRVLALIEYDMGNYETADAICCEAVRIVTQRAPYRNDLAKVKSVAGRVKRALNKYEQALELLADCRRIYTESGMPKMLALVLCETALVYERLKDLKQARCLYREARAHDSPATNYRCTVKLGVIAMAVGDESEARERLTTGIALCRQILEKTPRHYDALYSLALAEVAEGHTEDARRTYERALDVCAAAGVRADAVHDLRLVPRTEHTAAALDEAMAVLGAALHTDGVLRAS